MERQRLPHILPLYNNKRSHDPTTNGHAETKTTANHSEKLSLASKWRNELVAMAAEFAGTFMFLFFAFGGTQVANRSVTGIQVVVKLEELKHCCVLVSRPILE